MPILDEKTLRHLYLEQSLTETEIASQFGIYQVKVNRFRKLWGIETKLKSDRFDLPDELTPRLKSILLGSMLGDGGLSQVGSQTARYTEHHCLDQKTYLEWKASEWGSFVSSFGTSDKGDYKGFRFITHTSKLLHEYWKLFYPSGSGFKIFYGLNPDDIDPLALAVWFMDDGVKANKDKYLRFSVSPDVLSQQVQIRILEKFGIKSNLHAYDGDVSIYVCAESTRHLVDIIFPHLIPSMQYKIGSKSWEPPTEPRNGGRPLVSKVEGLTEDVLRQLYLEMTDAQIAEKYNVTDVLISYYRRKWNIPTVTQRQRVDALRVGLPKLEDLTPASLAVMYEKAGDREIAKIYGVSKPTIAKLRRDWGVASLSKSDRLSGVGRKSKRVLTRRTK